jgi:Uma2 family endonuclease
MLRDAARISRRSSRPAEIVYADSDGMRMAVNTEQWDLMVLIKLWLEWLFADVPDVFIAGDLLWYPVEGDNKTRMAPDVMAAFGRPKGRRGSYMQWREGGIPFQVTFEILSPNNTKTEMKRKFRFYQKYGVEEYYVYDPDTHDLQGWRRLGRRLVPIPQMIGWISPRLGIRFEMGDDGLLLLGPNGEPFVEFVEVMRQRETARRLVETERHLVEVQRKRVDRERKKAERERRRADAEKTRADRLAARLRELGIDPDQKTT